ncbi:MAG: serine hydrolase, partial [Acidobacteriaceae bacterium]
MRPRLSQLRTAFLLAVAACLTGVASAQTAAAPAAQTDAALTAKLQSMIGGFRGDVSFYAHDLATGRTVAINADQPVPTASVIKLAVLYEALQQIRSGRAHFNDPLTVTHADQVPGSGVLLFFDTPLHITFKDGLT